LIAPNALWQWWLGLIVNNAIFGVTYDVEGKVYNAYVDYKIL